MKRHSLWLQLTYFTVAWGGLALFKSGVAQDNPPPLLPQDQLPAGFVQLTDKEIILSYSVLLFGLLVLCFQVYLLRLVKADAQDILVAFALTIIIIGGLYLVTIGLSSEQIAPAFSLYGAIVGYLLGRESARRNFDSQRKTDDDKNHGGGSQ